jgi:membrane-bound lytic murein transglycosylase B
LGQGDTSVFPAENPIQLMKLPLWRTKRDERKTKKKIQSLARYLRKLASLTMLSVMMPVSLFPTLAALPQAQEVSVESSSTISLDTSSSEIVVFANNVSSIQPGSSKADLERIERQKAEALTRAKAQAEADAKRLSQSRSVTARDNRSYAKDDFMSLYKEAESEYGVAWQLLLAIHYVESGQSGYTSKSSYAGATGPMQFMPSTFRKHKANPDADIRDPRDSIFAAARYLKASGYPDVRKALWSYNPSQPYYRKVRSVAEPLGLKFE